MSFMLIKTIMEKNLGNNKWTYLTWPATSCVAGTGREPTETVLMQTEKLDANNRCKGQSTSQLLQSIIMLRQMHL
jgi:hypothetical protein